MGVTIVGTGHVLKRSVVEVKEVIERERPDFVALELDERRFGALMEKIHEGVSPSGTIPGLQGGGLLPLLRNVRELGVASFGQIVVGRVLGSIQKSFGDRFGVFPGQEMAQSIKSARFVGARIVLIDRKIEITLNRLIDAPISEKLGLLRLGDAGISIKKGGIENLVDDEVVVKLMGELRDNAPGMYGALVDERDKIMAQNLYDLQKTNERSKIVAVVGAGHKRGVRHYMKILEEGGEIFLGGYNEMKPPSLLKSVFFVFSLFVGFIILQANFFLKKV